MSNKHTVKALEELVKTEYMAVAALEGALEEVDDNKLRKNFRKWRDSHSKQAEALNNRLEELGGDPIEYEAGAGKVQGGIWGKLTGGRTDASLAGMRVGAERGIKRYIDHIDDVDDPKALSIIRKNLEAKQDEIEWYDSQLGKERNDNFDSKLDVTLEKAKEAEAHTNGKKGGGLPFPLLIAAGAIGALAYFLLRRSDDDEYDDYSEDAFRYETEEPGAGAGDNSNAG